MLLGDGWLSMNGPTEKVYVLVVCGVGGAGEGRCLKTRAGRFRDQGREPAGDTAQAYIPSAGRRRVTSEQSHRTQRALQHR